MPAPYAVFILPALGLALAAAAQTATTVTVHPGDLGQEFQGMGCGAIFYEAHITSLGANGHPKAQERLYDDMFKNVRTDLLQVMIRHDHEPRNDNDDPYAPAFSAEHFDYCRHPLEIAAAAKKRRPGLKLHAVLYTPPPWMKTNNDPSAGGKARATIKPGLDLEVGEYIWAFLQHMSRKGQPIDYLSICNEPDWEHDQPGYFLTGERHAELFKTIADYLDEMARRHPEVPNPKLVAPNMLSAVDTAERFLPMTLSVAGDQVDIVGNHDYDRRGHRWAKMREVAGDRPLWVTEYCFNGRDESPGLIRSAGEFWLAMTEAFNDGVNVWMAYDWVYPPRQGGEALIHVGWGRDYTLTKIYHGFRQWCGPLRPGMRVARTDVTGPFASGISKPGVKASAFRSADGRTLVVHIAAVQEPDAEIEIQFGSPFDNIPARLWRTSREEDAVELPVQRVSSGRLSTLLPGRALLTLRLDLHGSADPRPVEPAAGMTPQKNGAPDRN